MVNSPKSRLVSQILMGAGFWVVLGLGLGVSLGVGAGQAYASETKTPPRPRDAGKVQQRLVTSNEDYIPVPGLAATISSKYSLAGILQVDAGIEIKDTKQRERAIGNMPRVRDAMLSAVAEYVGSYYVAGSVPNPVLIKRRLQASADRILGPGVAKITLANVMVQTGR